MAKKLSKMAKNCPIWPEINRRKRPKVVKNGQKLSNMAKNQLKKTAKSCPKWPKIVENGQNQTEIKLILPGKTELEVHQLTPSKLAPLNPPVSAGSER